MTQDTHAAFADASDVAEEEKEKEWQCPRCGSPELDEQIIEIYRLCAACNDYDDDLMFEKWEKELANDALRFGRWHVRVSQSRHPKVVVEHVGYTYTHELRDDDWIRALLVGPLAF